VPALPRLEGRVRDLHKLIGQRDIAAHGEVDSAVITLLMRRHRSPPDRGYRAGH
jgi:hypothetical protein